MKVSLISYVMGLVITSTGCSALDRTYCGNDPQISQSIAIACVEGQRNCYSMPGMASAQSGALSEREVRNQCASNIKLHSASNVAGGGDYIYTCSLGYITGVVRIFLSNTPSNDGRCYIARYAYAERNLENPESIIPLVSHFE